LAHPVLRQNVSYLKIKSIFLSGGSFSLSHAGACGGTADPVHILASSLKDRMKYENG